MTVCFLVDEDIAAGIIQSLRTRESTIDIFDVKAEGLRGMKDEELLELAAQQDRILISHDRQTMTRAFHERLRNGKQSPGLLILSQQPGSIGEIVDWLLLIWAASRREEWRNQVAFLPIR